MKQTWPLKLATLGLLTMVSSAQAEVFHTARTLKPGAFSLGIEPQVYLSNPPTSVLNLHGGAGLAQGIDLRLKLGLPLPGSYAPADLGGDVEFLLLPDAPGSPALSFAVGAHSEAWRAFELDFCFLVSKVLRRVEPYGGIDADLSLPPYEAVKPYLRLVGGLNIHLARVSELMLEIAFPFPGTSGYPVEDGAYLSAGINFYL
ncbi:MAG: hypothetical protein ACKO6N_26770 [Myxococcota bacterium]